jgi:hypothetical protein
MSPSPRNLDPDLLPMAESLPAVLEFGDPAVIAQMRTGGMAPGARRRRGARRPPVRRV